MKFLLGLLAAGLLCTSIACVSPGGKNGPTSRPTTQPVDPTATLREPVNVTLGKLREPLAYRIVSFHKGKADKRLIRLASELGFNGVQIQIEGSTVDGIKAFAKYDAKEKLVDFCHSLGMKVTLWVHELSDVPGPWMPEFMGALTPQNQAVWSLLEDRYDWMLKDAVPNIDGLVLTTVETKIGATDTPVFLKLCDLLRKKCDQYKKQLIVRTFVWYPDEFKNVMAAIDQLPKDQVIMSKCVPQDWNSRGMDAAEIGAVGGRTQIIEFDVAGEYFLRNIVPNCMPNQLKRQLDYAISKGATGGVCIRVDRDDDNILHEPSEVNLWTLGMLAGGVSDDLEEIWNAWADNRFGKPAAAGVIRALKPTGEIVEEMLSIGHHSFGDTRKFPFLGDEDFLGQLHQNWWWDEKFSDEHFKAEVGEVEYTKQVAAAKEKAEKQSATLLMDLDLIRDQLKPEDYAILRTRLLSLKAHMEFRGPMAVADLYYRQLVNADNDDDRDLADAMLEYYLDKIRVVARPIYGPWKEPMNYLGKKWYTDFPDQIDREGIYRWVWKMEKLRKGEDPRPITPGHGLMPKGRRPTAEPATRPAAEE